MRYKWNNQSSQRNSNSNEEQEKSIKTLDSRIEDIWHFSSCVMENFVYICSKYVVNMDNAENA